MDRLRGTKSSLSGALLHQHRKKQHLYRTCSLHAKYKVDLKLWHIFRLKLTTGRLLGQKQYATRQSTISELFKWIVRLRTLCTLWIFFTMKSQLKHWKYYKAQLIAYEETTQKFANLLGVSSLTSKIKVLNCRVLGT